MDGELESVCSPVRYSHQLCARAQALSAFAEPVATGSYVWPNYQLNVNSLTTSAADTFLCRQIFLPTCIPFAKEDGAVLPARRLSEHVDRARALTNAACTRTLSAATSTGEYSLIYLSASKYGCTAPTRLADSADLNKQIEEETLGNKGSCR